MWRNWLAKQSNSVKKSKKRLLRRSRSFKVTDFCINRKPVWDFLLVINSNWHPISYRFGVVAACCSNIGHFPFLSPPPRFVGGLGTTYDVHLGLIWKRVVDFLFATCYGWGASYSIQHGTDYKIGLCLSVYLSVCQSVSVSVRLRALSRSHFLIDFHQNWHRRKNAQKEERVR